MAQLMTSFEWGTLENGFATVDGVFLSIHPRRSRGEASFVSSHGAVVGNDYRLPFDEPLRFIAPAQLTDRKEATLKPDGLSQASEAQFAMGDLRHERYSPFDSQTGLFRAFASLWSEADVIAFANRFGPLGADLSTAIVDVVPEESWKKGIELYWAEPIDLWLAEAKEMARAVGLWELIRARDWGAFQTKLTKGTARLRIKTGSAELKYLNKDYILAKKTDDPTYFQEVAEAGEQDWPRLLLLQWINRGAGGRTDLGLGLSGRDLNSTLMPRGLIGALWQQAGLSIDGHVDFLKCLECSDWFGISAEHARPEKQYCSDACRMRAYRKRKKNRKEPTLT